MRRIAVLSACVLFGGLVAPTTALAAGDDGHKHQDGRWIAEEDQFAVVLPDGTTFGEEDMPPGGDQNYVPPVGTRLFIGEVLYKTDNGTTRGDEVGRSHIECTVQVLPDNVLCDIAFVFDDSSQLHGSVLVDFSAQDPNEPAQFDIAVTGGTGKYSGASGVVSLLDTTDTNDPQAPTTTLYEADLS